MARGDTVTLCRLPADGTLAACVSLAPSLHGGTALRLVVRLPLVGGARLHTSLPDAAWLRERGRWEVSLAVVPPLLVVLRAGFLDRTTGDTPIVWTNRWPRAVTP